MYLVYLKKMDRLNWEILHVCAQFHAKNVGISKSAIGLIYYIDKIPPHMSTYWGIIWVSV